MGKELAYGRRMDRDYIKRNLMGRIDDPTHDRIKKNFPVAENCPTCSGRLKYNLDFKTYDCDCEIQKLLQRHYFAANIPKEYHGLCIDQFQGVDEEKVISAVTEYVRKFADEAAWGAGITFDGPFGTGKTMAMCSVLKEMVKQGRNVYFITFQELIDIWGSSWHDDTSKRLLSEKLKGVELLGLDELRSDGRNVSGFLADGLDAVIRHRTSNLLPTLITTNMKEVEREVEFPRAYSLLAPRNEIISLEGHDQRKREILTAIKERKDRGERLPIC
jgi:DNA replication protein DnaC